MPPLPPDLLAALVAPGGGRVVLILGAGCSVEPPTSLRLSREYAREAHHHLVADHILDQGQCPNPDDLSSVADSVWEATGSQEELIRRLPVAEFRNAAANDGYILAAALLREHVIACVMTLNFDLAMSQALASVGAKGDVSTIGGPQDHGNLGLINLIYLHRNAHAPANDWILRSTALQQLWQGAWEEAITHRVVAAAVTVFAGLGSPAAVLIETTQRIRGMLGNAAAIYQVDRVAAHQSAFFAALGLPAAAYIRTPWTQFMRELAQRVVVEHREELRAACLILQESEGWEPEDVDQLCDRVLDLGLLGLGQLRARWLLSDMPYIPRYMSNVSHIADLMLVVRLIERRSTTSAKLGSDGVVEFWEGGDEYVVELDRVGEVIHNRIVTGNGSPKYLKPLLARVHQINERISPLTDNFSYTLGEANRALRFHLTVLILVAALFVTLRSGRVLLLIIILFVVVAPAPLRIGRDCRSKERHHSNKEYCELVT